MRSIGAFEPPVLVLVVLHLFIIHRQLIVLSRQGRADGRQAEARFVAATAHLTALRRSVVGRGALAARVVQRRRRRRGFVSTELLTILREAYDPEAAERNPWDPEHHCHLCSSDAGAEASQVGPPWACPRAPPPKTRRREQQHLRMNGSNL